MSNVTYSLNRLLRGAGGGGRGGGYTGSRGSYRGSSNGADGDGGSLPPFVPIAGGVLALFLSLLYICWFCKSRERKAAFDESMDKAKSEVELASRSAPSLSCEKMCPHSGVYATVYVDRGTKMSGTLNLAFTDNGSTGYKLTGSGTDIDGKTTIEEGYATYDGKAWWTEKHIADGMLKLSKGTFDYESHEFHGEWLSSTNTQGTYISFRPKHPPPSAPADSTMHQDYVDVQL